MTILTEIYVFLIIVLNPIDIVINHLDKILGVSIPFNEIFRFYWAAIKEEFINSFKLRIIECLVTVPIGSEKNQ